MKLGTRTVLTRPLWDDSVYPSSTCPHAVDLLIRYYVVRGPWSVVRGPWSVVRGPWSVVRGPCIRMYIRGPCIRMYSQQYILLYLV
jgi:hypothetical protein